MTKAFKKKALKKEIFSFSRLLHVYLSTFLFSLLIFFSVTGVTLNHRWYDSESNQEIKIEKVISTEQLAKWVPAQARGSIKRGTTLENSSELPMVKPQQINWNPDITKITNDLRQAYSLPVPTRIDLEPEFKEIILDFKVPAGFATVTLSFEEQTLIFEQEKGSLLGILNDLHKGRHSGKSWSWLIDLSAGLIVLFSITGLIILFQGKKYRRGGVFSFLLGTLTPYFIYLFFVPLIGV